MKKFAALAGLFLLLAAPVFASSQQAYNDYLYQFDLYRQKYNDFLIAKNAYEKYKTLDSQTQALSATKFMLSQRDLLLHSYLVYLYERVGEQGGITAINKQLYQSLLTNELSFLENQSNLVSSINTIDDATNTSEELESHYNVLSATIRQIIIGISLGQLNVITQNFDLQLTVAQNLFAKYSGQLSADKKSTINNWVQTITNKRTLYQQKIDDVTASAATLADTVDAQSIDTKFGEITTQIGNAKQYLADAIANLGEVVNAMQYQN